MRFIIESQLQSWKEQPIISDTMANSILKEDILEVRKLFEPASCEISRILYQNMWNKFRAAETEQQMGSGQV